jgi:cytochrome c oxidase cbb3-type subunit I/II
MLSTKNLNAIAHYTDWIPAHVHVGGLGWNGFLTFGMLYWLFPKMWRTELWSTKLANAHFWIGTLGIVFWTLPMYWAGWTQASMWKQFTDEGMLAYPNFLETVTQIKPMFALRAIGGLLYFTGAVLAVVNLWKTATSGSFLANESASAPAMAKTYKKQKGEHWHRWIERKPMQLLFWSFIAVAIGGVVEMIPTFLVESNVPTISSVKPYTPLELEGRDIYIREGCNNCHSQMIRPFRSEVVRYGEYSKAGEFVYDHPFLWGSKRTGPDLHREGEVGGKMYKNASWHYNHMYDPTSTSSGSIMPPYPWLIEDDLDYSDIGKKISAMRTLGVPYPEGYEEQAVIDLKAQQEKIFKDLKDEGIRSADPNKEIVALIAYLHRLGRDITQGDDADEMAANK